MVSGASHARAVAPNLRRDETAMLARLAQRSAISWCVRARVLDGSGAPRAPRTATGRIDPAGTRPLDFLPRGSTPALRRFYGSALPSLCRTGRSSRYGGGVYPDAAHHRSSYASVAH